MSNRTALEIKAGTTFRVAFRFGENYSDDDEVIYDDADILAAKFKIRSGDHRMTDTIPLVYDEDGYWNLELSANLTDSYDAHRALYWSVDCTFASSDVVRMQEGPLRVRNIGGVS
jgi:hypothetical protein